MFPLRDENPTLRASVVTGTLIAVNVLVWIFVQGLGARGPLLRSICQFGLIPGELLRTVPPDTAVPIAEGMVCVITDTPNWWTLLTSMFLHGGWFHLIGNMWFLAVFGDNVEDALGRFRFLVFYLLCGLAAAAAQILTNPRSPVPMVGASGAISGVMGAYALLYPRAPVHLLVLFGFYPLRYVVPAVLMLGYWFLLQFLGGLLAPVLGSGGIAFWAHVGGFVAGLILAPLFCDHSRVAACRQRRGTMRRVFLPRRDWSPYI